MPNRYLVRMRNPAQRWFKFHNVGPSPHGRSAHAMASDGTRVFVLGGYSKGARPDEISLIHVFDTSMYAHFVNLSGQASQIENTEDIKYPEPERNAFNHPNEKTTQLAQKPSTCPPVQEQPESPKSSSSEAHNASCPQNAAPAVSGRPASPQITDERNSGPNGQPSELTGVNSEPRCASEGDASEDSTECHAEFAVPHSSSFEEVTMLELERQLSVLLAAQTERDHRITQLTDELALRSAQLEQAEVKAADATKHAGLELRRQTGPEPRPQAAGQDPQVLRKYAEQELRKYAGLELRRHADRLLRRTSFAEQRDTEFVDMQAKLDKLVVSHGQEVGQYESELTGMRAKLEAKVSELEAVRLRLADAERSLAQSRAEADTLRTQTAVGSVDRDEGQVTRRLMERMRAIETEVASKRWNEKMIEEMECTNEG